MHSQMLIKKGLAGVYGNLAFQTGTGGRNHLI
jgi:hypothetical protein